jgi:hypothetical protein
MPVTYTVLDFGSFVYTRAEGVLTEMECLDHQRALMGDKQVRPRYRHLLDARPVTEYHIDAPRLLRGLQCMDEWQPRVTWGRCAVVAHDSWWFDIAFQQECGRYGLPLIAFNDPVIACLWLGADYTRLLQEVSAHPVLMPVEAREPVS